MTDAEFTQLADKYKDRIYRLCYTYLRSASDCDDAVQETLIKLYLSGKSFKDDEHIRNWLFRVAVNECRHMLRSRGRTIPLEEAAELAAPPEETKRRVYEAVRSLEPGYRVIVHLYYYENMQTKNIAALLKLNAATVRTRLKRAREQLKTQLNGVDLNDI